MLGIILGALGNLLGGPFAKAALDAYRARLSAENASEKIAADLAARELAVEQRERELASQSVLAEQGRWYTALPRPLFAFAFVIYVWKVVVWDKVLALGSTDPNVTGAIQVALEPRFIPYYVIAIGLITEIARRRTISRVP